VRHSRKCTLLADDRTRSALRHNAVDVGAEIADMSRHDRGVKLPDWIDTPVPPVAVDETHDAIGKLVAATRDVESLLAFAAFRLGVRPLMRRLHACVPTN